MSAPYQEPETTSQEPQATVAAATTTAAATVATVDAPTAAIITTANMPLLDEGEPADLFGGSRRPAPPQHTTRVYENGFYAVDAGPGSWTGYIGDHALDEMVEMQLDGLLELMKVKIERRWKKEAEELDLRLKNLLAAGAKFEIAVASFGSEVGECAHPMCLKNNGGMAAGVCYVRFGDVEPPAVPTFVCWGCLGALWDGEQAAVLAGSQT